MLTKDCKLNGLSLILFTLKRKTDNGHIGHQDPQTLLSLFETSSNMNDATAVPVARECTHTGTLC